MKQASKRKEISFKEKLFEGPGEMRTLMKTMDWAATPVSTPDNWPQSLQMAVSICLQSYFPILIIWGPNFSMFYNDAYIPILGNKHPGCLGNSAKDCMAEIWHVIGPMVDRVLQTDEATMHNDLLLIIDRNNYMEEAYFTFSYSPLPNDEGRTGGLFCAITETTARVLAERRLQVLGELITQGQTVSEAIDSIVYALSKNPLDIPFGLFYLPEDDGRNARLAGAIGLKPETSISPATINLEKPCDNGWPLTQVINSNQSLLITDLTRQVGEFPNLYWPDPPSSAMILPIILTGLEHPSCLLVLGISPLLKFDESYQEFFKLLSNRIAKIIHNAKLHEEKQQKAESLAALDMAKIDFFKTIGQEFRNPVTLILEMAEEVLTDNAETLSEKHKFRIEKLQHNGLRLLKLINTMLDFSNLETGRLRAAIEPTNLPQFTSDLVSVFFSLMEKAGLRLIIDCQPQSEPAYVDQEMWEKIVLNLVLNAFKYTFEGEIRVSLRKVDDEFELQVADTGVGISSKDLPLIFEKFHRFTNVRARTHQGAGIGLALVKELVNMHGGTIEVSSKVDQGSIFTVKIPNKSPKFPETGKHRVVTATTRTPNPYLQEAIQWMQKKPILEIPQAEGQKPILESQTPSKEESTEDVPTISRPHILLVDDNIDMCEYIKRLLNKDFNVNVVHNGKSALDLVSQQPPDILISDVMMPELNGFDLLKQLRADAKFRELPIILLSASADEESRIKGLDCGADDYLTKPFSSRDLLSRIYAHLKLSRLRNETHKEVQLTLEALRVSEERYRALVSATTNAVFRICEKDMSSEGLEWWQQITGQSYEEIINLGWLDALHPDDREQACKAWVQTLETKCPYYQEYRLRTRSGDYRFIACRAIPLLNSDGSIRELVGTFTDITKRKQVEELQARLAAIVESSSDAIISLTPDYKILTWNPGAEKLFNYSFDETLGRSINMIFPAGYLDRKLELHKRIGSKERIYNYETTLKKKGGNNIEASLAVFPIEDSKGKVVAVSLVARDITGKKHNESEQKRLLHEAKTAQQRAEAADHAKDEFLTLISHEMRNPLNAILGWAQALRMDRKDKEIVDRAIDTIERSAKAQVKLIEDLLDISNITKGKLRIDKYPVEIASTVHYSIEISRPAFEVKAINLNASIDYNTGFVLGDPERLQQVILNLLNNAIKFTPKGGSVEVKVSRVADTAQITVSDTGIGINKEFLPYIFERFRQAVSSGARRGAGLGIGLSLARHLIELHKGSIQVESDGKDRGTKFTITLPLLLDSEYLECKYPQSK